MRITKVKLLKDAGVEVRFQEKIGKTEKETVFKCVEKQDPDLNLAFVDIEIDVRKILNIPTDIWHGQISITGVSFSLSEETGVEGAVITGKVALETSNAPFCFNTPHLPFAQYSPTGDSPIMPESAVRKLDKIREEAEKYMAGKRAQRELAGMRS